MIARVARVSGIAIPETEEDRFTEPRHALLSYGSFVHVSGNAVPETEDDRFTEPRHALLLYGSFVSRSAI
jgi:hypothetical protein